MLVLTQSQEIVRVDFAGQPQPFRAQPNPFTGDMLSFIIVIANTQVFLEVFPCVLEIILRLGRDHAADVTRTVCGCGVGDTPPHRMVVLK